MYKDQFIDSLVNCQMHAVNAYEKLEIVELLSAYIHVKNFKRNLKEAHDFGQLGWAETFEEMEAVKRVKTAVKNMEQAGIHFAAFQMEAGMHWIKLAFDRAGEAYRLMGLDEDKE